MLSKGQKESFAKDIFLILFHPGCIVNIHEQNATNDDSWIWYVRTIYLYSATSHLMKNYFTISINSEFRSLKIVLPVLIDSFHNGFSIPQIPRGLSLVLVLQFCWKYWYPFLNSKNGFSIMEPTSSTQLSQINYFCWTNLSLALVLWANPLQ